MRWTDEEIEENIKSFSKDKRLIPPEELVPFETSGVATGGGIMGMTGSAEPPQMGVMPGQEQGMEAGPLPEPEVYEEEPEE